MGTVFAAGLVLRWWAIFSLGRLFTVDVAIADDHELIVRGPYHLMRHPSYSGMMLAFAALAVTFQNWLSLACVLVPISAALAYRIYVEEIALEATFGDAYREYAATTKRLIPGLF
jgi:protein-S-isoprenylcysteine O-methyltransferase